VAGTREDRAELAPHQSRTEDADSHDLSLGWIWKCANQRDAA
jgi:hypothetical protein